MRNSNLQKILSVSFIGLWSFALLPLAMAQISYTSSDLPSVNDTIRTSSSIVPPGLDYVSTGADWVWDFSSLFPLTQSVDTFVSVSSTPFFYQLVFIPNIVANLAQPVSNFDSLFPLTGLDVSDIFRFYKKSTNSYQDVGFAVTFQDIPLPIKYNTPDVIYKLPVTIDSYDSSLSGFQIGVPDLGYLGVDRKRVNKADGFGTVITPYGTFPTLRLKSTVYETDTFYLDTAGFGQTINRETIEYKWLVNGKKLPLIQFTETSGIATVTYIDSVRSISVDVAEYDSKSGFHIFPNPATDCINISCDKNAGFTEINLYNSEGRLIRNLYSNVFQGTHKINLKQYSLRKGLHLLEIKTKDQREMIKLIIQ